MTYLKGEAISKIYILFFSIKSGGGFQSGPSSFRAPMMEEIPTQAGRRAGMGAAQTANGG